MACNCYRRLFQEEKNGREYVRNIYWNISEEDRQKLRETS